MIRKGMTWELPPPPIRERARATRQALATGPGPGVEEPERPPPKKDIRLTPAEKARVERQEKEFKEPVETKIFKPQPGAITPRTKRILGIDVAEHRRMLKSFVPGLLTAQDWKHLSNVDRAASIAGDIGQTILYVVPGGLAIKYILARGAAKGAKGTFPRDVPGLKTLTKAEVKAQLKQIRSSLKDQVKPADLKKTVLIDKPVKFPKDTIYIVKEGPAGRPIIKVARKFEHPDRPKLTPPSDVATITKKGAPPGFGGARVAPASTATMTLPQLLRQLGIDPKTVTTVGPVPLPKPSPKPRPGEAPEPKPKPSPKPSAPAKPATKPVAPTKPAPKPLRPPGPKPVKPPKPTPVPKPAPKPGPKAGPEPEPEPAPKAAPEPKPKPAAKPAVPPKPMAKAAVKTAAKKGAKWLPPPPILPAMPKKERRKHEALARAKGALGWKQGNRFVVIVAPYNAKHHVMWFNAKWPPQGFKVVPGKRAARDTIQRLKGYVPKELHIDMGKVDDIITKHGPRLRLEFRADPHQLTTGDISFKGTGRGIGGKRRPRRTSRLLH